MPIIPAFLHIQQVAGGEELAEADLRQRLVNGEVGAQDRLVTPGGGIEILPLAPKGFEDGPLFPRVPERLNSLHREAQRQNNLLRRVERLRTAGHNYFLLRADVDRVWPVGKPKAALPTTRPKELGPKAWLAAQEVYKFRREGGKWINIEKDLLPQIRNRLGGDQWLSNSTLKTALAYLKKNGLLDF
jgi:hypothetical protein